MSLCRDMMPSWEWRKLAEDQEETITKLRAEVDTWQRHAKLAIWSDSEECKLLTADNERLRAALQYIAWEQTESDNPHLLARAALEVKA